VTAASSYCAWRIQRLIPARRMVAKEQAGDGSRLAV
jgi:hypothetical protein